jgi:hypothetical protein
MVYPLIITDLGGFGEYGFDNFLSIVNESKSKNADILHCKGSIPDVRIRLAGKPYSEIFVLQASDAFINILKRQLGDSLCFIERKTMLFILKLFGE